MIPSEDRAGGILATCSEKINLLKRCETTILYLVEGESGLGEVGKFQVWEPISPKLSDFACYMFLDRSRSSVGVGGSFCDMSRVWCFFFDFSFFVVSGSAEGSRKVPQI